MGAEVNELKTIAHAFGVRYGKEFIRQAMNNLDDSEEAQPGSGKVSQRVMHKLTDYTPKASLVDNYLVAIAQTYGVTYMPPIRWSRRCCCCRWRRWWCWVQPSRSYLRSCWQHCSRRNLRR